MLTSHKPTLKDHVYQQIIEMICDNQLKAGEIVTEKQLIAHFGMSKSPVREALIQLCHDNVLSSIPRCGYQVIQITTKDVHDLTELRLYVEIGSLQRLIDSISPECMEHLLKLNRERARPVQEKDIWTAWNNNVEFHLALMRGAGNALALDMMKNILSICTRAYAQLYYINKEYVVSSNIRTHAHEGIVQALQEHDFEAAKELLTLDIRCMETRLLTARIL